MLKPADLNTLETDDSRFKILVVEDETILAEDIVEGLRIQGYEALDYVTTGEEAIAVALRERPNLILMDVNLAGKIDGVEAASRIREQHPVPVVYLSAYTDDDTIVRARNTEPFGYLVKPVEERELRSTIEMALSKDSVEKELRQNRQLLASTLESLSEAVLVCSNQGELQYLNPSAERLLGASSRELLLRSANDVLRVWQGDKHYNLLDFTGTQVEEVIDPSNILFLEVLHSPEPVKIPVELRHNPIDPRQPEAGFVFVLRDISERYRILQVLFTFSEQLTGLSGEAYFHALLRQVSHLMGMEIASVARVREAGQEIEVLSLLVEGEPVALDIHTLQNTPCAHTHELGYYEVPDGLEAEDFVAAPELAQHNPTSYVGVRLENRNRESVGLLWLMSRRPLPEDPLRERILQLLASRVGAELARQEAEAKLQHKEREQATLLDSIPLIIQLKGTTGKVLHNNQFAKDFFKEIAASTDYKAGSLQDVEFSFPGNRKVTELEDRKVLETGKAILGVQEIWKVDGKERIFRKDKIPFVDDRGRVTGVVVVAREITERVQAERELRLHRDHLEELVAERTASLRKANQQLQTQIGETRAAQEKLDELNQKLQEANQALEQRVAERTRELRHANRHLQGEIIYRKEVEENLRRSEALYRSTISAMEEGVLIANQHHEVLSCNHSAEVGLGISLKQLAGRPLGELFRYALHPNGTGYPAEENPVLNALAEGREFQNLLVGYPRTPQDVRWFSLNLAIIEEHDGAHESDNAFVLSISDITERRQSEDALRRSHELLATVYLNSADGYIILEGTTRQILSANRRSVDMIQCEGVVIGEPLDHKLPAVRLANQQSVELSELLNTPDWQGELQFTRMDGSEFWADVAITSLENEENELHHLRITDITNRKQAEMNLLRLQAAVNHANEGVLITAGIEPDTGRMRILYANNTLLRLLKFDAKPATTANLYAYFTEDQQEAKERIARALETQQPLHLETTLCRKDEGCFAADFFLSPVRNSYDEIENWVIILRDISQKKEIEAEIERQRRERQDAISRTMIDTQEKERSRIAEDLHDGLGHNLSVLKMNLSLLNSQLQEKAPDENVLNVLQNSQHLLDETTTEVRNISRNLTPNLLYDFGLQKAINNLVRRLQEGKSLAVHFEAIGLPEDRRLSHKIEITVYRIVQEFLNNTVKYANASEVTIQLALQNTDLMLIYEDDGIGFDPATIREGLSGIGLRNIEARARLLGGNANIDSSPGHGVTGVLEIPNVTFQTPTTEPAS